MKRGAQHNPDNRFLKLSRGQFFTEATDETTGDAGYTQYLEEQAKTLVNKVDSPDVGMYYSMNPYQGCEHGCAYCYARNTHEFYGYSAGIDFEQKIIVKKNAPQLLENFLMHPQWEALPIALSGNTDCYQPAEQQFRITRKLLEVCNRFNQPVSIITKNAFVLKDADILTALAGKSLTAVMVSLTTFNEPLRRAMEPRTTTAVQRLEVIRQLSKLGIPTGVMMGPVIPGLNDHEMKQVLEQAAEAGATMAAYTFIRLNGSVQFVFHAWLHHHFPERALKVWHMIQDAHGGRVSDSRFGIRMRGEGVMASLVHQQFKKYTKRYGLNQQPWRPDCTLFSRPGSQLKLF